VEFSHSLIEQLDALSDACGEPGIDLSRLLSRLTESLVVALPSFVGLTLTVQVDGLAVDMSGLPADRIRPALASLYLPIPLDDSTAPTNGVVFYAAAPDAFLDLAEDARWVYELTDQVIVDGHLPSAPGLSKPWSVNGIEEFTIISQAIGVVIEAGLSTPQAHSTLQRRAFAQRQRVVEVAQQILADPAAFQVGRA